MFRKCLPVLLVTCLFSFYSCSKKADDEPPPPLTPVDLLPEDNEISGWTRDGAPQTAEDPQELWAIIDGEGQVYVDHGFVEFARQLYQGTVLGTEAEIRLDVSDQGSAENAKLVYDDERSGTGYPWTENHAGTEARIDDSALGAYAIHFFEERFFVKLTINQKNEEALDVLKLFARNVSDKIALPAQSPQQVISP